MIRSLHTRHSAATLLVLGWVLVAVPVGRLGAVNDLAAINEEEIRGVNGLIQTHFSAEAKAVGGKWSDITRQQAWKKALEKNFSLQGSQLARRLASTSVTQAQATFDTQLSVTMGYDNHTVYNRVERDKKYFPGTISCKDATDAQKLYCMQDIQDTMNPLPYDPTYRPYDSSTPIPVPPYQAADKPSKDKQRPELTDPVYRFPSTLVPIAYIRYTQNPDGTVAYGQGRPAGDYEQVIDASKASITGPTQSANYVVSASKQLPWGVQVSASQNTVRKDAKWVLNPDSSPTVGSYDRPWSSSVSAALTVPVPGGKHFGRLAPGEVAVEQAVLGDKQADLQHRAQVNQVLLEVDRAFWTLVAKARILKITLGNRDMLEKKVEKTRHLLNIGKTTNYGMAQIETELVRVKGRVVTAWQEYLIASNALNELLSWEAQAIFQPVGYSQDLETPLTITLEKALQEGQTQNPVLDAQQVDLERAQLSERESIQRTKPDVTLTASVAGSQSANVFGYAQYSDSMQHLITPDKITLSGGGVYRYPWMNQGAQAVKGQAQTVKKSAELRQKQTVNQVVRNIKNAYATLNSARERMRISDRYRDLARQALEKAEYMMDSDLGQITAAELIVKNSEWLEADNSLVQAKTAAKMAESALLAAMGKLERIGSGKEASAK